MRARALWVLGVSATLLALSVGNVARAQRGGNIGRQIERGFSNNVGNMITGSQPNAYQNQFYGRNQPFYGANQGLRPGYGWPGSPYRGSTPGYYPQPMYYGNQSGQYVQTQPTYDRQLQPTTYVASPVQRYQIPAEYAGTPAGYVITYGGRTYLSGSDGTMTPYSGPVAR